MFFFGRNYWKIVENQLWNVNWLIKLSLIIIYIFVSFWIFFTSSLWLLYFGLELQWMLFVVFFIYGKSIWKGLINYVIFNELVGTLLILGLILYINIFFSALYYGKIGFYPFMIPMLAIVINSPYTYILFDPFNKFLYIGSFLSFSNYLMSSINSAQLDGGESIMAGTMFLLIFVNFSLIQVFGLKYSYSFKSLFLISSLINFLLIMILILLNAPLFAIVYFFMYYFNLFFLLTGFIFLFNN